MRESMRKKHIGSIRVSLLLFLSAVILTLGCGHRADSPEDVPGQEMTDIFGMESQPAEEQPVEGKQSSPEIAVAPLLIFEDPETENLAGMLQEESGGMMVQLAAGRFMGSGILYKTEEEQLIILTAGHVLEDAGETVQITFFDGWEYTSPDFEVFESSDLAVVRIPLEQIPTDRLATYCLANVDKESYDRTVSEDGCIVMGSRSGVAEDAYEGYILEPWIYMEDYGQYMMWVDAAGKPGMSGGGLFDRRGHLLGILSGRSEDGQWAVVPLALVLAVV